MQRQFAAGIARRLAHRPFHRMDDRDAVHIAHQQLVAPDTDARDKRQRHGRARILHE